MKAFVLESEGNLAFGERPVPAPSAPDEVLLKVMYAGICGTDVHTLHGIQPSFKYPRVLGHEMMCRVETEPPAGARDARGTPIVRGAKVLVDPSRRCGECVNCRAGKESCCERLQVYGVEVDGCFAEYVKSTLRQLTVLPDEIPDNAAMLVEPMSIAMHALKRGRLNKDDSVLLIGSGTIGLSALVLLKSMGCRVVVMDLLEHKRRLAAGLGADLVLDASAPSAAIIDETAAFLGGPPSVVIDAVGADSTIRLAVEALAKTGRIVLLGLPTQKATMPIQIIMKKEMDVIGTRLTDADSFPELVDFLVKHPELWERIGSLVTHTIPFAEFPRAYHVAEFEPNVKVVVAFHGSN